MRRAGAVLAEALGAIGLIRPSYRLYEALRSALVRKARRRAPPESNDDLPIPPARLITAVAGTPDVAWFLEGGRLAAESIAETLARNGLRPESFRAMLDFGCGCGRVVRRWRALAGTTVCGSDHDARLVAWCEENLPFARFATNGLRPPLPYLDAAFDLVYALSVLTHLPEELQAAWTDELARVLEPGGYLLLTTHGPRYLRSLTEDERRRFEGGELVVRRKAAAGTNLCTVFHPERYVRERLARGLEIVEFVPEGAKGNPHQDVWLLRKPLAS